MSAMWFENGENVVRLARYLNEHDYFTDDDGPKESVEITIRLFEAPYKAAYDILWRRMNAGLKPDQEFCSTCKKPGDAAWILKYGQCDPCDSKIDEEEEEAHAKDHQQ